MKSIQKRSIETVLDPTFLLTKEDYSGLYDKERILKEKYIFLYTINYDEDALKQTVRVAEMMGEQNCNALYGI